jgi:uncharacterized membrane protein
MTDVPASRFVSLRNAFISGALLLAPLFVTVLAFGKVIDIVGGTFGPVFFFYLPDSLRNRPSLAIVWDILATIIIMALVTALGYVSRYVFGKFFLSIAERLLLRVPGVGGVYTTVKQIVSTFGSQNRSLFNQAVLVEFPRAGCWTVGFLTNRIQGEVLAKAGEDIWSVFVPTTPNPTSGFLLFLPRREIVDLDMKAGEAMKLIISGGAVVPPWRGGAGRAPGANSKLDAR